MQYQYGPLINRNTKMPEIQRRATKQLPGMKDIPYQERLERLKLPTHAYRRTRGVMVEVYKLLQGKDACNIVKLHMIRYAGNCPLLTVVRAFTPGEQCLPRIWSFLRHGILLTAKKL